MGEGRGRLPEQISGYLQYLGNQGVILERWAEERAWKLNCAHRRFDGDPRYHCRSPGRKAGPFSKKD